MPPLRSLAAGLVLLAAPALAQSVCPDLEGAAALTCVVDGYRPASVLSLAQSKDRLYDTIDRTTDDGVDGVEGIYTGHFVAFDGVPSADPSQDVYNSDGSDGMNQEHVFPRSRGVDGTYAERDLHHLYPARGAVNSARGNDPFGALDDGVASTWYRNGDRQTSRPSSPDDWSQSAGGTFEPRASKRGDVARAMFYVAAVYAAEVDASWFGDQLETLLAWHEADPASSGERARSRRVADYQSGCGAGDCVNPFAFDATLARRAFAPETSAEPPPVDPPVETPTNRAPLAATDEATTDEDERVIVAVLGNDSDPDADALAVTAVGTPDHGAASTDGATVAYTPAPDFSGSDTFDYTLSDGEATATGTVRVTVRPVNDAPSLPGVTAPAAGARVTIAGDPATRLAFAWTASSDAERDPVAYRWELSDTAAFDAPLLAEVAQGPNVSVTVAAFADALASIGVGPGETADLYHRAVATDGKDEAAGPAVRIVVERGAVTGMPDGARPASVALWPNPAREAATVALDLPSASDVRVSVYDALGREVAVAVDAPLAAGRHEASLVSSALPSGAYVVRVSVGAEVTTRVLLVAR